MNELKSCKYNRDNGFVELRFVNGTVIPIDCNAVEDDVAETMYDVAELNNLIFNEPLMYANLVLHGDIGDYLRKCSND